MNPKRGIILDIENSTIKNTDYRHVLYTSKHLQLVLMSIDTKIEIGEEVHHLDQFIRVESGEATVVIDGDELPLKSDHAVIIPAGTKHNVINTGGEVLKLYTLYAPPEHKDQIVQHTKADEKEEHFDGQLSPGAEA